MAEVTEIKEESAVQLEIVESGGGRIEITDNASTQIEIIEVFLDQSDLDITTKTDTLIVESTSDNTNIDVIVSPTTIVETSTIINDNVVELVEPSVVCINQFITQSVTTQSVINNTITTQSVINNTIIEDWDGQYEGPEAGITSSLRVSNTLFTDVLSASIAHFHGDGINNILIISSGSHSPITVNNEGLIIFDEFTYTPTVVEGGLLYSGSDFYVGLPCPPPPPTPTTKTFTVGKAASAFIGVSSDANGTGSDGSLPVPVDLQANILALNNDSSFGNNHQGNFSLLGGGLMENYGPGIEGIDANTDLSSLRVTAIRLRGDVGNDSNNLLHNFMIGGVNFGSIAASGGVKTYFTDAISVGDPFPIESLNQLPDIPQVNSFGDLPNAFITVDNSSGEQEIDIFYQMAGGISGGTFEAISDTGGDNPGYGLGPVGFAAGQDSFEIQIDFAYDEV